jgi:hypothetical protein
VDFDLSRSEEFHLGDILTVTTGRLVSPRHIDGVYVILNYMTGDNLFTHQLPRAMYQCAPLLLEQHPFLRDVEVPENFEGKDHVDAWLHEQVANYGEWHHVHPIILAQRPIVDPIEEFIDMVGEEKIIVVEMPEEQ